MSDRTETLTQASAPAYAYDGSYVDWSSIIAGAVVASAIAFVFTTFGTAVGLSMVSPYDGDGSSMAALIAVGSWMLWTTISSFMAGGYIAGRMRRRVDAASADEVSVRDGIHGLAVWGAAIMLGVFIFGASADTAVQATTETANAVAAVAPDGTAAEATEAANDVSEAEATAAAEQARQYAVVSAFVLAASLMIAAAGAYWAAGVGGQHRDESRVFTRFGRWT
ncbi:hypothetical protein FHS72_001555 [Loktanella ponticola]|uniref:PhnA-like protein n=1 Tax=Yoonia ponticola TaxID=1524255 RepID=A0A7W9EZG6_9RHOB|nr:hypothetical protein [Yoonia ponticola]MBB5721931.1 hypothetical protein [Yoonia ponticola]